MNTHTVVAKHAPLGATADGTPATDSRILGWAQAVLGEVASKVSPAVLARLREQASTLAKPSPVATNPIPPDPTKPAIIRDMDALRKLADVVAAADDVAFDLETGCLDPRGGVIVGIGLAVSGGTFYIPVNHNLVDGRLCPAQLTLPEVADGLRLPCKPVIAHNAKFDCKWWLHHTGQHLQLAWDTMIAARLLRSDMPADLKTVAARELDVPKWDLSKKEIEQVASLPINKVAGYCGKDCRYTLELYWRQRSCLN